MFGRTPFGQSLSSPFASQSPFGRTGSPIADPFAPSPFGTSQTGSPIFGGTSTGVFGHPSSFSSGSSLFGQKPAFGGFGSSPSQSNHFGSTFQQSQPAFGSNLFGSSTPFGASSQPAFGATSTPAFSATATPSFGATYSPAFGGTTMPAFGSATTAGFGSMSTSIYGSTGTAFGTLSTPAFGSTVKAAFGAPSTSPFGSSSTPSFGSSSVPAFTASSTPSISFGSTPSFGQSTSVFGSSPFGMTASLFGAQSSPFGAWATTPTFDSPGFGQSAFGSQVGGSRIAAYTPTLEDGFHDTWPGGYLDSISAMHPYKYKSHDELRWEDYQHGDRGAQAMTPMFGSPGLGQSSFGGQQRGSRIAAYTLTAEVDIYGTQHGGYLESISAMHAYKDRSHEELRWEDYQHGYRGAQATTPTFGKPGFRQSAFGGQLGGSRIAVYPLTPEVDVYGLQPGSYWMSVSAMNAYKDKGLGELRWEDCQHRVKVEEDLQTEEAQPQEIYHPTKSETLAAVSGKALMLDEGLNPAQPAEPAMPPLSSSQAPIWKEILNPSVQLKEAVRSAEPWTMVTGSTLGQILKEGQNLAQPHEAFQPMELAAFAAGMSQSPTLDEGLNPAQPQEAVPAPKPGTPAASSSLAPVLDEGLSPAMLTPPRFSRIAEASSFQTLTKQVVAWAHLKGDVDTIKTMLQEEPVPTDYVEELLQNMISEESVSGYCFKDFQDSVSQILNEIKRQQSVNLDSVVEELTTAKSKQLSNLRQSVNRYKFLMRGYEKEVVSEISLKAELVKNRGEIRIRMNTLEQELEQAKNAFAKNEAQIHKQDEAISKARACVGSVSQEIQKAEEECSQVEKSLDKVGEEAEAKMRKRLEGLQASKAVLLKFDMPQCLPRTY